MKKTVKKRAMFITLSVLVGGILFYCAPACAEHTGPGRYNNEDLGKYETPDNAGGKSAPNEADKISDEKKSNEEETQEREEWCRQGTALGSTISEAKKEIDVILDKFPEKRGEDIDTIELPYEGQQKKLDMSRRKLREAEFELSVLEDQAHAKGVPLGWIRCIFE